MTIQINSETYLDQVKQLVDKFEAEKAKVLAYCEYLINVGFEKDTLNAVFFDDTTVRWALDKPEPSISEISSKMLQRLIERSWMNFFTELDLYGLLGTEKRDKITTKYYMVRSSYYPDTVLNDVQFTVENLTKFVEDNLAVDKERFAKIPAEFLLYHTGEYNNRKTEYKTRMTVNSFTTSGHTNDRTLQGIAELVNLISIELREDEVAIPEVKQRINHKYGVKELECNLIKGVDFKLKPNGNVDLKLSKDIVEYLNSKL